ncbi:hypothetical protein BASA61_001794 [Batrachochytrium salamandrivorans]|nr:hypothetical protein BASA60_007294 [Batrachochytrium salamandrivorans]KAH6601767.1 hypothetical protein BASA61_001794 [Batrachochytrium salamandrivorans]KAH9248755.1 hypothetical protein BASA81_013549 [Batrachochytrium salamandrivorans]
MKETGIATGVGKTTSKTVANKRLPNAGGAFIKNIIKKGDRNGEPMKIGELDEEILKKRLEELDKELKSYKNKCSKYKKENDWYREEIEICQRDTTDYIMYLESKKNEKLDAIQRLTESNKKDMDVFLIKRKKREEENAIKISGLRVQLSDYEMKLAEKESKIMQLSDIMARRKKHEDEMNSIQKEMQFAESEHLHKMAALERTLLETRMKLQKEADAKINSMESAAHEKAERYLKDHTTSLELENAQLDLELRKTTFATQQQIQLKERLEQENRELKCEQRLRHDLVRIRLQKIVESQESEKNRKKKQQHFLSSRNKCIVAGILNRKGLSTLGCPAKIDIDNSTGLAPSSDLNTLTKRSELTGTLGTLQLKGTLMSESLHKARTVEYIPQIPEKNNSGPNKVPETAATGDSPGAHDICRSVPNLQLHSPNNHGLVSIQSHDCLWFDDDDDEY